MKRLIALGALAFLAGCASNGYYHGDGYPTYGYYGDTSPYVYDTWRTYPYRYGYGGAPDYHGAPTYYGGPALIGGGIYYDDRDRRYRDHRRDERQEPREWRDADRVEPAPAERADPDNVVRPRGGVPGERLQR